MTERPFPSDKQDKFMLRLPDGMRERIRSAADANGRSMNAEIIHTLESKYPGNHEIDKIAANIVRRIEAFKLEPNAARRDALIADISDLHQVLKLELERMQ